MRGDLIRRMSGYGMDDRSWRIVLKNSKIAGLRKSRKRSAMAISAAARCCRIDTRAIDRFCGDLTVNFTIMIGEDVAWVGSAPVTRTPDASDASIGQH